jgi:hypothetical protein
MYTYKLSIFAEKLSNVISFQSNFTSNSFKIWPFPDLEIFFQDADPAKDPRVQLI